MTATGALADEVCNGPSLNLGTALLTLTLRKDYDDGKSPFPPKVRPFIQK